jgi:serine O-acetyltransferase
MANGAGQAGRRIGSFRDLRGLWAEDWRRHRRRLVSPGLHVIAVHRLGVWAHGLGPLGAPVRVLHSLLNWLVEGWYGCELRPTVRVGRRVQFAHAAAGIIVHPRSEIGDDCTIRHNVTIGVRGDEPSGATGPRLGKRVEIGAGAVIIGSITIGDDVLIGANVVVRENVPAGCVVLPARPEIRARRRFGRLRETGTEDAPKT